MPLVVSSSLTDVLYLFPAPMNEVKQVIKKPKLGKGVVRGSLSTVHDQRVTIYADGSVFIDESEGNQVR